MSATFSIEVEGVDAVKARFRSIVSRVGSQVIEDAAVDSARPLLADLKGAAPFRSGRLKESLGIEVKESAAGRAEVRVGPRKGFGRSSVARWLERGTSKMSARPWMRPTADASAYRVQRAFMASVRRALRSITGALR